MIVYTQCGHALVPLIGSTPYRLKPGNCDQCQQTFARKQVDFIRREQTRKQRKGTT